MRNWFQAINIISPYINALSVYADFPRDIVSAIHVFDSLTVYGNFSKEEYRKEK